MIGGGADASVSFLILSVMKTNFLDMVWVRFPFLLNEAKCF